MEVSGQLHNEANLASMRKVFGAHWIGAEWDPEPV